MLLQQHVANTTASNNVFVECLKQESMDVSQFKFMNMHLHTNKVLFKVPLH